MYLHTRFFQCTNPAAACGFGFLKFLNTTCGLQKKFQVKFHEIIHEEFLQQSTSFGSVGLQLNAALFSFADTRQQWMTCASRVNKIRSLLPEDFTATKTTVCAVLLGPAKCSEWPTLPV